VLDLDLGLGLEGDPSGFFGSDSLGELLKVFNVCL
jgi:hypothetical protein